MPTEVVTPVETQAGLSARRLTAELLQRFPTRPAGTEASRGAADALKERAQTLTSGVYSEDFVVHPRAFLAWIRLLIILYVLGVIGLYLHWYWFAALLATLGLLTMIGQFFYYAAVLDRFFPRQTGRNVWAVIEPQGEVRGQVIISGHHDSARITNFLAHKPELYPLRVYGGLGAYALFLILSWGLAALHPGGFPWAAVLLTALLPLTAQLWFFAADEHTPGAGDNLASSAVAWEVLRQIKQRGPLQHLRVVAASWDAEECGLRGSRAWVQSRQQDERLTPPTWNLNLECLYNEQEFFLLTSDVNGTVKLDEGLARTCQTLLQQSGVKADVRPIAFLTGGTDAGEFGRIGVSATTLFGMPWQNDTRSTAYHTPRDTLETVSEKALEQAVQLGVNLALHLDHDLQQR